MGGGMPAAAWVVKAVTDPAARGGEFYDVPGALLAVCLVVGVLATAYCAGRNWRWTGLLVALSPGLVLAAFINWDLLAMALTMAALAAWAARRPAVAGLLPGLGLGPKVYPRILPVPLFLFCPPPRAVAEFCVDLGARSAA